VFDSLSGDYFWPGYNLLNPGGRLIVFGSGSLMPAGNLGMNFAEWIRLGYRYSKRPTIDLIQLTADNKAVFGFNLIWLYEKVAMFDEQLQKLQGLNLDPPTVGKTFNFQALPDALKYFQTGKNVGKVVLVVGE